MKAFDGQAGRAWAFILAHPDDEIGIAAWMARLARTGNPIRVIWLHSTSIREAESRAVMTELGISDLSFWTYPDGRIAEYMPEIADRLRAWLAVSPPDRVVTHAYENGHLDHDAAHAAVRRAFGGPILEFPMYHPYGRRIQVVNEFAHPAPAETLPLSPAEAQWKRHLSRRYPSQRIGRILALYDGFRWATGQPRLVSRELMRFAPAYDLAAPAHRPEVSDTPDWRTWTSCIDRLQNAYWSCDARLISSQGN